MVIYLASGTYLLKFGVWVRYGPILNHWEGTSERYARR